MSSTSHSNKKLPKIVVCEDDNLFVETLRAYLAPNSTNYFSSLKGFLENPCPADLFLIDLCHPEDKKGTESLHLLKTLKERFPQSEIIILSGISQPEIMRKCIEQGAHQYFLKEQIISCLPHLLEDFIKRHELRKVLDQRILGTATATLELKSALLNAYTHKHKESSILIEGPSGCGKELCANFLAHSAPHFVRVNAASIPSDLFEAEFFGSTKGSFTGSQKNKTGYFESVQEGCLFMDEIQSLALSHQAKLLRVLEQRKFMKVGACIEQDFSGRFISATNCNLERLVQENCFRQDLYFRLSSIRIKVPALSERREDIPLLIKHFFEKTSGASLKSITPDGINFLAQDCSWPGNIRELNAFLLKALLEIPISILDRPELEKLYQKYSSHTEILGPGAFQISWDSGFDKNLKKLEAHLIRETLKNFRGSKAFEKLKMSRSRFYDKVKEHSQNEI